MVPRNTWYCLLLLFVLVCRVYLVPVISYLVPVTLVLTGVLRTLIMPRACFTGAVERFGLRHRGTSVLPISILPYWQGRQCQTRGFWKYLDFSENMYTRHNVQL